MDDDDKADPPNPEADKRVATNVNVVMQGASPHRVEHVSLAKTVARTSGLSPMAQSSSASATIVVPTPRPAPVPTSTSITAFPLYHVPEDQVGASKEALIQAKLTCEWLKDAYDASEALQTNF